MEAGVGSHGVEFSACFLPGNDCDLLIFLVRYHADKCYDHSFSCKNGFFNHARLLIQFLGCLLFLSDFNVT